MTSENELTKLTEQDVLRLPADASALDARATEIATNFVNEHVVRLELAAICQWRQNGSITGQEVYNLAAKSIMASLQSDDEFLAQPVYADGLAVWGNLQKLAACEAVTFEQEPRPKDPGKYMVSDADAYDVWRQHQRERAMAWFQTTMNDLDRLLSGDYLFSFEIDSYVPYDLRRHISHEATRKIFDGLLGTGASLHYHATNSTGGLGLKPEAAVYFADGLARSLSHGIQDLDTATDEVSKSILIGHVELWWGLLKGFIYSGAHTEVGYNFGSLLSDYPEIKDRIVQSLEDGITKLTRQEGPRGWWGGGSTALSCAIAETPTSEVIQNLVAAIEDAERSARVP